MYSVGVRKCRKKDSTCVSAVLTLIQEHMQVVSQLTCVVTPLCSLHFVPGNPSPPLTLRMFHNETTFCALMIELSCSHLPAKLLRFHASTIFPQHIVCRRTGTSLSSPCIYIHSGSKFCFSKSCLLVTFNCRKNHQLVTCVKILVANYIFHSPWCTKCSQLGAQILCRNKSIWQR